MNAIEKRELREEVKQYIDHADDPMLITIYAMLKQHEKDSTSENDWLEEISEEEKAAIEISLKQLDNGGGIPHHEATKRLKWFPK